MEVNGEMVGYYETGREDADYAILNLSGLGARSGKGNLRLADALSGKVENSRGMQTLRDELPKGAEKIEDMIKSLSGTYRTITPETPGGGFGSEVIDDQTLDGLADHFADFAKKKGLQNVIIFGSSMGGALAIRIAARHPELTGMLALQGVMTEPDDLRESDYKMIQKFTTKSWRRIISLPVISHIARFGLTQGIRFQKDFRLADKEGRSQMLRDSGKSEVPAYLLALSGIGEDLGDEITKIDVPVVLLDGANVEVVSFDKTKKIAERFHPEISGVDDRESLMEKIKARKVLIYKIGGKGLGEQTHSVLNTTPEIMAVMTDHATKYFGLGKNNSAPTSKTL